MDFSLSEEQEMLKKSARDFLTNECPKTLVREMAKDERGFTPELWRKMADLGWIGLVFPEQYGGSGFSFLDLAILLEETGRACLPGPLFSTAVLAGLTIMEAGSEEQKKDLLPKIAQGNLIATVALNEPDARYEADAVATRAVESGDSFVVNGTKLFVPDANVADYLICAVRTQATGPADKGISLLLVDAKSTGITTTVLKTMVGDKLCEVVLKDVKVPKKNLVGKLNGAWPVVENMMQKWAIAKCAEMLGGAQYTLEMSVQYAKDRVQFGRPIGSFQAIQHHCANMVIDVDGCRFVTWQAAWMLSQGMPCTMQVSVAKAWTSDAYRRVTALGHQIHGGIGFCDDHDMPFYFKRAKAGEVTFGDADYHREVVAQQLGL